MALIVQKFGGTSVADIERLQNVASIIQKSRAKGHQIVAVVSAMAGVTNQLLSHVSGILPSTPTPSSQGETDVVLAAGEQVTTGLLSLCLQNLGIPARSFLSWQIPLTTDHHFTNASIHHVNPKEVFEFLNQGGVPVIAGFQGVCNGRITTLGRGGSDLTAVAMADALKADFCDIYTDVAGVYTADPRLISNARKITKITFPEMLELAVSGAKVLQDKCVAFAHEKKVRLRVLSSFQEGEGTEIVQNLETPSSDSQPSIQGIAHSFQSAKISLRGQKLNPVFIRDTLNDHAVHVEGITHHVDEAEAVTLGITKADLVPAVSALQQKRDALSFNDIDVNQDVAKISIVGQAFSNKSDLPTQILKILNSARIFAEVIEISKIKMMLIIKEHDATQTIRLLHDALNLDACA